MKGAFVIMAILVASAYINNMIKYVFNLYGILVANRDLHHEMLE